MTRIGRWSAGVALLATFLIGAAGAQPRGAPVTAEQDHRAMLDALGIAALRPGPSGDPAAPNAANTDPARANPYPDWPELLRLDSGERVRTPEQWWRQRRPEIAAAFEREVYGRVPGDVPSVTWRVESSDRERIAGRAVTAHQLVGHVDNRRWPAIAVDIRATLVLPDDAPAAVPVMMMFAPARYPAPSQPTGAEAAAIDRALKSAAVAQDPALAAVFAAHPGFEFVGPPPFFPAPPRDARIADVIAAGWGVALLDTATVQADSGAGLREGIIGLVNRGKPRTPEDWGALRAWGWGASRLLDHLATIRQVDRDRVAIEGVSRWGKAALVTAAFDRRFAAVLAGSPGAGGIKPFRRNFGEAVENLASSGEYHWFAGAFLKYAAVGGRTPDDLPVETHQLLALVAPRLAFISYGVPEAGDAHWLDQQGSFMATVAAGPAWTLLGARDLGVGHAWRAATMPPVGTGLLGGDLAWRQHDGGHTDAPNIAPFLAWADARWRRTAGQLAPAPQVTAP